MAMSYHFGFENRDLVNLANSLNVQYDWNLSKTMGSELAWNKYTKEVIDALVLWCKDMGITEYCGGSSQIAVTITFKNLRDAMVFKMRWKSQGIACELRNPA